MLPEVVTTARSRKQNGPRDPKRDVLDPVHVAPRHVRFPGRVFAAATSTVYRSRVNIDV